jgi:DUF4097 and DUF4098 domain-containing protein YvlB
MDDRNRYNNNGTIETSEGHEAPEVPVYTPKRRMPWNRLALILIIMGSVLFMAGWLGGSRGGSLYFQNGQLRVRTVQRGSSDSVINALTTDQLGAEGIRIHTTAMNIVVLPNHSNPRMEVFGDIVPVVRLADNILTIDTRQAERNIGTHFMVMGTNRREIRLYLPHDVYEMFDFTSVSGNISVENFTIESGNLRSISGRVSLNGTTVNDAEMQSTSGNVIIDGGSIFNLTASSISGNVTVDTRTISGGSAELRSVSGTVRFTGQTDSYTLNSRSGSVRVNGNRTGNVQATVRDGHFMVDMRTTSGNVHLNTTR